MADRSATAFSHPIGVETLRPRPTEIVLAPDSTQRAAIARALDLASLDALEGRYRLSRESERVTLEGRLTATLEQRCVVTLEPLPVKLDTPVDLVFEPKGEEPAPDVLPELGEIDLDFDAADPPEAIVDGTIDFGAVTLEFLALALDPYPRKPGVAWEPDAKADAVVSPFAALARLKRDD